MKQYLFSVVFLVLLATLGEAQNNDPTQARLSAPKPFCAVGFRPSLGCSGDDTEFPIKAKPCATRNAPTQSPRTHALNR
jgi:hypothetical protein